MQEHRRDYGKSLSPVSSRRWAGSAMSQFIRRSSDARSMSTSRCRRLDFRDQQRRARYVELGVVIDEYKADRSRLYRLPTGNAAKAIEDGWKK